MNRKRRSKIKCRNEVKPRKSKYFSNEHQSDDETIDKPSSDDWVEVKEDIEYIKELKEKNKQFNNSEDVKIAFIDNSDVRLTKKNQYMERLKSALKTIFRKIYHRSNYNLHIFNLIVWIIHIDRINKLTTKPFYRILLQSCMDDTLNDLNCINATLNNLNELIKWFKKRKNDINYTLFNYYHKGLPESCIGYVMLASILRIKGFFTRLVVSLQPWNPKVDMVKSRKRYTYKKGSKNILLFKGQNSDGSADDDESVSDNMDHNEEASTKISSRKKQRQKMPLGHHEILSIIHLI